MIGKIGKSKNLPDFPLDACDFNFARFSVLAHIHLK